MKRRKKEKWSELDAIIETVDRKTDAVVLAGRFGVKERYSASYVESVPVNSIDLKADSVMH